MRRAPKIFKNVYFTPASFRGGAQKSAGRVSRVRTAFLDMEPCAVGSYQGATLDELDVKTLIGLLGEIDEDSHPLLTAYLDRREPYWRESASDDDTEERRSHTRPNGKMTDEEAYQILGIQPGATAEEVARAHRSLIKKLHPDLGGSTYLAAKINEAKEVLTRRQR